MLLNLSAAWPEFWVDGEGLPDEVVEHHMGNIRLRDDKVAIYDAKLGAVLESLAVKAQLIQEAPAGVEKRHLFNDAIVTNSQLTSLVETE